MSWDARLDFGTNASHIRLRKSRPIFKLDNNTLKYYILTRLKSYLSLFISY